jgi:peroxiredoxin
MVDSLAVKNLGYALYSDRTLTAAREFGIVFQLDDSEVRRLKGFGVDIEDASGEKHHQLPVPSVFLVDAGGTIRWVYSNPDYRVRPDTAKLLAVARTIENASLTSAKSSEGAASVACSDAGALK